VGAVFCVLAVAAVPVRSGAGPGPSTNQ
jgi:hypothetical protein